MKVRIQGQPEFLLPLTIADVEMIRKVSAQHYDAVCREASGEAYQSDNRNFLTSWRNILQSYEKYPPTEEDIAAGFVPTVSATWRQIDTVLKILEPCNTFMLTPIDTLAARHLSDDLLQVLRAAGDLYGKWSATIETK